MKHPWFGPKTIGWGWAPITWQGWKVLVAFIMATLAVSMLPGVRHRLVILIGLVAISIAVVALTGTKPGGNHWRP